MPILGIVSSGADLPTVEILTVAGGGGGGQFGGGGAGGLVYDADFPYTTGISYTVTVGAGGPSYATSSANGSNSVFNTYTAIGGGQGARGDGQNGTNGGSGGGGARNGYIGGSSTQTSPTGAVGFGTEGGYGPNNLGGGGGGAGSSGGSPAGGDGKSYFGSFYAGGGGGATIFQSPGSGGSGGGGTGAYINNSQATDGTANTGGGGGGGSVGSGFNPKTGGSGVVIVRYVDSLPAAASTTGSPTITVSGGYRTYKFTGSGSITF